MEIAAVDQRCAWPKGTAKVNTIARNSVFENARVTSAASIGESSVRCALHRKLLSHYHRNSDAIVINELGLIHSRCRVDIAVINGWIHGYEIKSDLDTLARLPQQLELFGGSLQKLTLIVGIRHLSSVTAMLPSWCGLAVARTGPRGGIKFERMRRARSNPHVDPFLLAHLLWRSEAETALYNLGATIGPRRQTRKELYTNLVEYLSTAELVALIKRSMNRREGWRGRQPQRSCDD